MDEAGRFREDLPARRPARLWGIRYQEGLDFSRLRASSLSQTFLFQSRAKTWKTPTLTLDESCPHHTSTPT